jgi:uncharacterized delta-60 repeat protein
VDWQGGRACNRFGMARTDRKERVLEALLGFGLALLAVLVTAALAQAKPGDLDRSFGGDGKVRTKIDEDYGGAATSVAIDSRGRTIAAGTTGSFAVARYKRNGRLDGSFSGNGKVITSFGRFAQAQAVAIDPRGRIVAAGFSCFLSDDSCSDVRPALVRYRRNGTLDPAFGSGGKVTTDFGGANANSVAIDSHGRVIVTGGNSGDFGLLRYKWNGSLDPSFGSGGRVTSDFGGGDGASGVAIDSHRRIVAAGSTAAGEDYDFALARFEPNGDPDGSFGSAGQVTTVFGGSSDARSVAIDSRDRIVAAGYADGVPSGKFALARYKPNGDLDDSFSGNGKLRTRFGRRNDAAHGVTIDSRDRIVAVGGEDDFRVARYWPSGRLDRSFSGDGKVTTRLAYAQANSVAVDAQDRIVAAGTNSGRFELVRYVGYRRR